MKFIIALITATCFLFPGSNLSAETFNKQDWTVRCWNFDKGFWQDMGLDKMTILQGSESTKITNNSGIHKHAHLVFPAKLKGDFKFTIELKGGYELGFLNRKGKDEMLYIELGDMKEFEKFELIRQGTRFIIKRNGQALPLVHYKFDYGEDFVLTLAIKQGESAEIKSHSLESD